MRLRKAPLKKSTKEYPPGSGKYYVSYRRHVSLEPKELPSDQVLVFSPEEIERAFGIPRDLGCLLLVPLPKGCRRQGKFVVGPKRFLEQVASAVGGVVEVCKVGCRTVTKDEYLASSERVAAFKKRHGADVVEVVEEGDKVVLHVYGLPLEKEEKQDD